MTELKMMHKVFVYGSLKSGFGNHHFLQDAEAEFLGTTYTKSTDFLMFSFGAFPAVVKNEEYGYGAIEGELYMVDALTMFKLDMLEGNGTFYTREKIELDDGNMAWMYLIDQPYNHMSDDDDQIEMGYYDEKMVFIWREKKHSFFSEIQQLNKTNGPYLLSESCESSDCDDFLEQKETEEEMSEFEADEEWNEFHAKFGNGRHE